MLNLISLNPGLPTDVALSNVYPTGGLDIDGDIWVVEPLYKISNDIIQNKLALFEAGYYRLNIFIYLNPNYEI